MDPCSLLTQSSAIPILQNHIQYLIDRHTRYSGEGDKPEELGELFSTEWTRAAISDTVSKGSGHLTQVSILDLRIDKTINHSVSESNAVGPVEGLGVGYPAKLSFRRSVSLWPKSIACISHWVLVLASFPFWTKCSWTV